MCDRFTERENELYLSRRQLGTAAGAATVLAACGARPATSPSEAPAAPAPAAAATSAPATSALATRRRAVLIDTPDGQADGVLISPTEGTHPGVILWPDVAGLREAYETMATRLAGAGYAVLAVNPYYRSAKSPVLTSFAEWRSEEGRAKIAPMREALSPEAIARDGAALVAWLDQQSEVDRARKIGAQGYCMTGSFTFRAAAAAPERVGAIASFHGGGLVTDAPDSPHTRFAKMKAAALICVAQNDHERDPSAQPALEQAAAAAGIAAEIEVYPANHGWCTLDAPVYDEAQAERAWSRLLATYAGHL